MPQYTHLVGLVVVLWVVLEDLGSLLVVEIANKVVYTAAELSPPVFAVDEPGLCEYPYEMGKPALSPYIFFASSTLNFRARRNRSYNELKSAMTFRIEIALF